MEEARLKKIRKALGERIRTLRKTKGYSQEQFAYDCDLHRTYMGDVERGERNVSIDNIAIIAATLNISISELFSGIK
jgi:transcriptional regulator with XRE-family HTH domain